VQDSVLAGLQSRVMIWIPAAIRRRADGAPIGAVQARVIADVQRNAEIADFERLLDRLAFEDVESAQRREIYLIRDQILLNAEGYPGSLMGQLAATYAQRYRDAGRLGAHPAVPGHAPRPVRNEDLYPRTGWAHASVTVHAPPGGRLPLDRPAEAAVVHADPDAADDHAVRHGSPLACEMIEPD
jgi:hypothetical protein